MQRARQPCCHVLDGRSVYNCFRYFNGVPHTMLATVEEHFTGNFPTSNEITNNAYAQNQSHL